MNAWLVTTLARLSWKSSFDLSFYSVRVLSSSRPVLVDLGAENYLKTFLECCIWFKLCEYAKDSIDSVPIKSAIYLSALCMTLENNSAKWSGKSSLSFFLSHLPLSLIYMSLCQGEIISIEASSPSLQNYIADIWTFSRYRSLILQKIQQTYGSKQIFDHFRCYFIISNRTGDERRLFAH